MALGIPTNELQHRISAPEFGEYCAFFSIEPYPEQRQDIRTAMLLQALLEPHRDKKRRLRPFTLDELIPKYWERPKLGPKQTPETMANTAKAFTRALGGKVWER